MTKQIQLNIDLPKHNVGTKFMYRRGKLHTEAEIVGYNIDHNTDTNRSNVTYRIQYAFGTQVMVANVARSTVDMAMSQYVCNITRDDQHFAFCNTHNQPVANVTAEKCEVA